MATGLIELTLENEAATARLGEDLAAMLRPGDLVALSGELGAGKSTLARAVIRALADDPDMEVPSPTFTLVQPYEGRIAVLHADLYRLSSPEEVEELGLDEALAEGAMLVEWPEKAGDRLTGASLMVALSGTGASRHATISGEPEALARVERSLDARSFLAGAGAGDARRLHLTGDASMRAYETILQPDQPVRILMNAPRQPDGPPIRDGKPYSQIAHLAESVTPFVAIARLLRQRGFSAPAIDAADLQRGFLLIEHLGSEGLVDDAGRPIAERYLAAAELLAELHAQQWPGEADAAPGVVHRIPAYDLTALSIETELLIDWYFHHLKDSQPSHAEKESFLAAWRSVFRHLERAEKSLVLRDFHSPNLIWRSERRGLDRIGLIDFQDALIGPSAYDVASLAQDARVTIEPELEIRILRAYRDARRHAGPFDEEGFARDYAIMAAQRNTKILGIFVRLCQRDGKPVYIKHLPRLLGYLRRVLDHPALEPVAECYRKLGLLKDEKA